MTEPAPNSELPKTFDPAAIEAKWYRHWETNGLFRPDRPNAEPYTIVNPPPNVTGSLHIGHALDNTLQDIMIRYERLRGKDALWVVGTDHAGIATQMVVERQLEARQDKRTNYSREDFVAKVWEWKAESGGTITQQLRRLGCSMDWSREQFTMDPHFTTAVTKVFVDLYNKRLIYRDKRLVNWDPKLKTAISDLEVETQEIKGGFWRFRYPFADGSGAVEVATTRPETMLADMCVAVNPADARYAGVIGKDILQPLTGRVFEVVADEHADPELGSGVVKITPGHDFNDFEVGKRAGIKPADMLNMFDAEAQVVQTSDGLIPEKYLGLDRFVVREMIVADMKAAGFLIPHVTKDKDGEEVVADFEPRTIATPFGDRGGVVIEPWLTDQWYVNAEELAKAPLEAVRSGAIEIVPKSWEKTFFNWMENIQPWCVSRQLWWGHRIPAWYGPRKRLGVWDYTDPIPFVGATKEEALVAAVEYYSGEELIEVEHSRAAYHHVVTYQAGIALYRDPDVLDTWFSSALWPFATLGWPNAQSSPSTCDGEGDRREAVVEGPVAQVAPPSVLRTATSPSQVDGADQTNASSLLTRHYPNNLLISGFDILFFWDARMMMMGQAMTGQNPWPRLYLHGLVRAPDGQKMSKSKGNVVDPLGLIDQFGADALRFFMAAMESQGRDIKMDERRVEGYRNFATKLWNAARFCQSNGIGQAHPFEPEQIKNKVNARAVSLFAKAETDISLAMADLRFDEAANAIYHFIWDVFCDQFIENAKVLLRDAEFETETRSTLAWLLDQILIVLHPFMPFITEELWHGIRPRKKSLIVSDWPSNPPIIPDFFDANMLEDIVDAIRSARVDIGVPPAEKIRIYVPAPHGAIHKFGEIIKFRARVSEIILGDAPANMQTYRVAAKGRELVIPLEGVIDIAAEKARLTKALETSTKEAKSLAGRLSNPAFVEKAKLEAVEKARADHAAHAAEAARLAAALARLG